MRPVGIDMGLAPSPRILVVDDDARIREVIGELLSQEGYQTRLAASAESALRHMSEGVDLVLSDLKMPVHDGIWLLDAARVQYPELPFILLTACNDTEGAIDTLRRGATDYLLKPPRLVDMIRGIERALSKSRVEMARIRYQETLEERVLDKTIKLSQALQETERAYESTLLALVAALDARERETHDHSQRVVRVTRALAHRLGITDPAELSEISRGALLHDIGKIGVSDSILLKRGPLTELEWTEMRKHPEIGKSILRSIPSLEGASAIVQFHHERFDGTGYPLGLRGEEIPLGARIFAIADTLDAITSDRPYRRGAPLAAAREELNRHGGTQFDPELIRVLAAFTDEELTENIVGTAPSIEM